MADEKQVGVGATGLLLVALAAIGVFIPRGSLDSERPAVTVPEPVRSTGRERVPARLWEDPLGAVWRAAREEGGLGPLGLKGACKGGKHEDCPNTDGKLLILTAFVPSGHYPENEEARRRVRYAIQSALNIEGYAPEDAEHLGALSFVDGEACASQESSTCKTWSCGRSHQAGAPLDGHLLPFEFFGRTTPPTGSSDGGDGSSQGTEVGGGDRQRVLVLWVPEEEFGGALLAGTHAAIKYLQGSLLECASADRVRHAFIGPTKTGSLLKLVKEDARYECCEEQRSSGPDSPSSCPFDGARLISSSATGRGTDLMRLQGLSKRELLKPEPGEERTYPAVLAFRSPRRDGDPIPELQLRCGLGLTRQIGTDDLLADLLLDELELRGVDLAEDEIVLIGEFGSSYSKMFLDWFEAGAGRRDGKSRVGNVRLRAYARGLDGIMPSVPPPAGADEISKNKSADHGELERPFGRSQVDYVRRLQQELEAGSYKAIGVVGQDVFDKLMLLRALRESFPRAILFTTDIDARYLQESAYPSVRNLIIASHYPLDAQVREGHDLQPLSFRGGYQTSNFYAAHRLIEDFGCLETGKITVEKRRDLDASIYEVGRSGFIELPDAGAWRGLSSHAPWFLVYFALAGAFAIYVGFRALMKRPKFLVPVLIILAGVAGLVAVLSCLAYCLTSGWNIRTPAALVLVSASLLLFGMFVFRGRKVEPKRTLPVRILALAVPISCGVLGILLVGIYIVAQVRRGEPLHWLEGVNVWPTIALRLIVTVTSVVALFQLNSFLTRSYKEISQHLVRGGTGEADKNKLKFSWDLRDWYPCLKEYFARHKAELTHLEGVWNKYQERSRKCIWRSLVFSVAVTALLASVYGLDQSEGFLARGKFAIWLDMSTWAVSLTALACLMFFVADATWRSCQFVQLLFRQPLLQYWEEGSRRRSSQAKRGENLERRSLDPLYVMRLAAEATDVASKLSWYPFTLLLVLILSQTTFIDNWSWSTTGYLFFVFGILAIVGSAVYLRRSGEALRGRLLGSLREELLCSGPGRNLDRIRQRIEEILAVRRGAFLPLTQHPAVAAMLLPFGGVGTIALLEMLNSG